MSDATAKDAGDVGEAGKYAGTVGRGIRASAEVDGADALVVESAQAIAGNGESDAMMSGALMKEEF